VVVTGIRHDPYQPTKETDIGEHTDKIRGRVKQAIGALTGDHELKREGERQERKGEVKGHIDDAVDKAKHAADDVKDNIEGPSTRHRPPSTAVRRRNIRMRSAPGVSWPRLAPACAGCGC
jgi:uncharacterized protein YjbJ (UPF0337 family)